MLDAAALYAETHVAGVTGRPHSSNADYAVLSGGTRNPEFC